MTSSEIVSPGSTPVPQAPRAVPVLGHTLALMRDPLGFLRSLPSGGDGAMRVRLGPFGAVVICDPTLTQRVLRDDHTFDKGGPLFDSIRNVAGNNVVTCPHEQHRRQRRLIQPSFHHGRFGGYAPAMCDQIETVVGHWHDGQTIDVLHEMTELTTRTFMVTMFSGALEDDELHQVLADLTVIVDGISHRMVVPAAFDRLPTPGNRRYRKARERMRTLTDRIVAERRADDRDHGDLLSALLAARDTDGSGNGLGFTDAEIYDQLIAFFLAGSETAALALAWTLHLLDLHPEVEQRLREEVDRVVVDGVARYEDLDRLTYTGQVISEVLRLYPPAWLLTRAVTADTALGDYHLSSGTIVAYSPYVIHHRGDIFDNAEQFDPDRWNTEPTAAQREAYIPSGGGARQCMGKAFGRLEATLALATITANWKLSNLPGHTVRPAVGASLQPRNLRMRAASRR